MKTKVKFLFISLIILSLNSFSQKPVSKYHYVDGYSERKAKQYFNSNTLDPIEGIWQTDQGYKLSIEKGVDHGTRSSTKYRAIILENNGGPAFWKPTYIKAYLEKTAIDDILSITWYGTYANGDLLTQTCIGVLEGDALFYFDFVTNSYYNTKKKVTLIKLFPASKSSNPNNASSKPKEKITGTGFAISSDGYIVTNYHVIENASNIKIKGVNGSFSKSYYHRFSCTFPAPKISG